MKGRGREGCFSVEPSSSTRKKTLELNTKRKKAQWKPLHKLKPKC